MIANKYLLCSIDGCGRFRYAKEWCKKHYQRNRVHGDPHYRKVLEYIGRCAVEGCSRPDDAKGYCNPHYQKWIKYGDPLFCFDKDAWRRDRFWSKVALTANPDKCWEWRSLLFRIGYGSVQFAGKTRSAHRVSWFLTHGVWPTYLLHSCHNRKCVNPNHLREGTHKENMQDRVRWVKQQQVDSVI